MASRRFTTAEALSQIFDDSSDSDFSIDTIAGEESSSDELDLSVVDDIPNNNGNIVQQTVGLTMDGWSNNIMDQNIGQFPLTGSGLRKRLRAARPWLG